jgi:molybdenum cofactor cytidylyltransferase
VSEIAAIILGAGRATRFGAGPTETKVVAQFAGKPLIRIVAESALASRARPVVVVIGHAAEKASAALDGLGVQFTYAADFRAGLSRSLRAGIAAVPEGAAGAVVLLADMPTVSARLVDQLIETFSMATEALAVVPTYDGQRGNPVLPSRKLFAAVKGLDGDRGASQILAAAPGRIIECPLEDGAIFVDIDTQEDLRRLDLNRSCADARALARDW